MSFSPKNPEHKFVCVIGAGISGIILGSEAHRQKVIRSPDEMVIFDRNGGFGGVWYANTYPGAACDIVSHIYSISWYPKADWSKRYSPQEEIRQYYADVAAHYNLNQSAVFNTTVLSAHWSDVDILWNVTVQNDKTGEKYYYTCNVLVSAIGQLNRARIAAIPGRESFNGPQFHTAEWNHNVDLTGKRVAVIGTGPSAGQVIPKIAEICKHVTVYQRSPPHIMPREDYHFSNSTKWMFKWVPGTQWAHHVWLYFQQELMPYQSVHVPTKENKTAEAFCLWHLYNQIPESRPDLREKLTPKYAFGCKRPLFLDDYYPAFLRDNVTLITDRLVNITPGSVVTTSDETEVDVIIWATGFITQDLLGHVDVRGTKGISLREQWGEHAQGYLGTGVHNFPNLLFEYGPATGLLWGSLTFMFETQALFNCQIMKKVYNAQRRGERVAFSPKEKVEKKYNEDIQEKMKSLALADQRCTSFYKNSAGVVTTNYPWRLADYWSRLWKVDYSKYIKVSRTVEA
ncbi:hypothetical protein RUND412_010627 [Rhizina undulata]